MADGEVAPGYANGAGGKLIPVCIVHVPIRPFGKERPRSGQGNFYTPKKTLDYEDILRRAVDEELNGEGPFDDPIRLELRFMLTLPATKSKKTRLRPHNRKPDIDNATKAVLDALNPRPDKKRPERSWRGVWKDDVQVVDLRVRKDWHISEQGVTIRIWRIV
jgi:Holliday junction resolvase RusA-like endonuclease